MKAKLIDGKAVSALLREQMKKEVATLAEDGITPGLAVVIVGDNPASKVYVRNKKKACEELGIYSEEYALPAETTQDELLALIRKLNAKPDIDGILVQLPLPKQLDEKAVIEAISPDKDVDAFSAVNVGKIMIGDYKLLPCTPAGIMELIHASGVEVKGKECVVIGRSNIVGKPMAALLLAQNATVTVCHSHTEGLAALCAEADILVAAVGRPGFITGEMIRPGAVVLDVGINRGPDGKLCGDVDAAAAAPKAAFLTPVPGGVGLMTRAMLMRNTLKAAAAQKGGAEPS